MKKIILISCFIAFWASAQSQYIAEVLEYKPAPGQLINESPWGMASSATSIVGGVTGNLTLGAWGGYVVFRFDEPVQNHPENPFGVDFTIFGNTLPDWSEPGVVWVMDDENNNGEPDDTWYQLAGSDYYFSNTKKNHEVTYTNPQQATSANVPYTDSDGLSGYIYSNSTHTQPYYPLAENFPNIPEESYTLSGTRIFPEVDSTTFMTKVYKRAFGYADNQLRGTEPWTTPDNPYTNEKENAGADGFDISWAVDANGNYVELDEVHFIKVQNGILAHGGWLGEISTEICGAARVTPNAAISGREKIIALRDLPSIIHRHTVQLEALAFDRGRLMEGAQLAWNVDMDGASINQDGLLQLTQSGTLTVTAALASNPEISATATTTIDLGSGIAENTALQLDVFPNPAADEINVHATNGQLQIFNARGQLVQSVRPGKQPIGISHLPKGLYILHLRENNAVRTAKLIKK
jgi:hypothetical protein